MNLIESFDKNLIVEKEPDKIIETIISKLYFYGDEVYKVYKYEKFFFGDFSSFNFRAKFYKEDFLWNKIMAPVVHLELKEVENDFYIKMKKFDDSKNFTNLLLQKNISDNDLKKVVLEMVVRLDKITKIKKNDPDYDFNQKLVDIHLSDLESDANLLYLIGDFISKEKVDEITNISKKVSLNTSYFKDYDPNNFSILIDNHADNIVFLDNVVEFVDVLPPKESWRVGDINFIISRMAVDVAVLFDEEKSKIIYDTFEKNNAIPAEIRAIYQIRSALIQMWCFYSQKKPDIAKKYLEFAESRVKYLQGI